MGLIEEGEYRALPKRGITEETCRKWGYTVGRFNDRPVQIANYRQGNSIVAQKVRFPDKDFTFLGEPKEAGLYGQHLWRDGGKMVVITEGEIDALTVSQLQGNKWPVVSLPNGAGGAYKDIKKALEWLEQFETIVLMFDMDEPGQQAVEKCASLFTPGKCKVARLPLKDANEMLMADRGKEVINAIWDAKVYRPDGIISGTELWDSIINTPSVPSLPYPWEALNVKTHGLRKGELVTFTAGSGIGKSQACREIAYSLLQQGETVGYVALEESVRKTVLGLMSIALNKPIHLGEHELARDDLKAGFDATAGSGNLFLYDHWGSMDSENLLARLRYLAKGCSCGYLILDHISIVVSGMGDGDERRLIDNTMTALRSLVEETGVGLILVSHLKRPEGNKGHEEGASTSLSQLRGSAAIAQLSDMVIGLERNQQGENPDVTTVRILKNRYSGETGIAGELKYHRDTGRLLAYEGFDPEGTTEGDDNPF